MKTGIAFVALLTVVIGVRAQESDDMYFNSKDRAKLNAERAVLATTIQNTDDESLVQSRINPSDSYAGRGENPEYTSRSRFNTDNEEADAPYFISGYQPPISVNQGLTNYNNSFYSPYSFGNNGFYNPYAYSAFSPSFYGGYSSGWSMGLGYSFGMGSGWFGNMNYGFGNMWGSPSNMFWDNYYGYGNYGFGSGFNNWGFSPWNNWGYSGFYPGNVIIINNGGDNGRNVAYRKRTDRSDYVNTTGGQTRNAATYTRNSREINSGGRTRSEGTQSEYYDRSWKRNPEVNPARSSWSSSSNAGQGSSTRSSWGTDTNSGGRTSSWSNDSGSRSSSWSSGSNSSSGSRSSAGSSSGSSSGGSRTRGRDN